MTGPDRKHALDRRVETVRRLLREQRTMIDPDPYFAERVIARLPRADAWMLAWAAQRVLPVTLTVAAVLTVAVIANRLSGGVTSAATSTAAASTSSTSQQQGNDPLDWLLESRQEIQ
jgi:hypothetical protein